MDNVRNPFPFVSKNNEAMLHTVGFSQQHADYLAVEKISAGSLHHHTLL